MEEERTKALVAIEKQKVAEEEAKTQKKIALSEAEKNAQVSKILMEQKRMEKDSSKRQQQIDNEMFLAREKALDFIVQVKLRGHSSSDREITVMVYLLYNFYQVMCSNISHCVICTPVYYLRIIVLF